MPSVFSISQRICRLPSAQLAAGATSPPPTPSRSSRVGDPVGQRQPVGGHVGPFALAHQAGNIDGGRALQPAGVAMDAQVGDVLELVAGQMAEVERAGQNAADQVGLRPRRSLFGRAKRKIGHMRSRGACVRHSPQRLQAATASATRDGSQFSCSSTRLRSLGGASSVASAGAATAAPDAASGQRAQVVAVSRSGSSPTILPGLRMFCGSKICFTSRNTSYSGPACWRRNAVRLRPQACSPLIAAADGEHLLVEVVGQPPHPLDVVRVRQIEERLEVQLPVAGVAEQRGGHLVPLQHVLHPHEEVGQAPPAARPCPRRPAPAGSGPSRDTAPAAPCRPGARTAPSRRASKACRAPNASRRCCQSSSTSRCSRSRTSSGSSPSCSTSSTASVSGGNQLVETRLGLAGEAQVPAVHQVAGRGLARQDLRAPRGRPSPGSRTAAAPRRDAAAAAAVASVASVIRASVPSEPASSRATSR